VPRLLKEFERVRQLGYAIDDEENSLGARCVVHLSSTARESEAAVASTGTITTYPDAVPHIADMVKEAARRISHQIGYRGPYPRTGIVVRDGETRKSSRQGGICVSPGASRVRCGNNRVLQVSVS